MLVPRLNSMLPRTRVLFSRPVNARLPLLFSTRTSVASAVRARTWNGTIGAVRHTATQTAASTAAKAAPPKLSFNLFAAPPSALILGFSGTIPFWAGTYILYNNMVPPFYVDMFKQAHLNYSASILGFMGAVHWGLEMAKYGGSSPWRRFGLSVVPCLVGWVSLSMPPAAAYATQLISFNALLSADFRAFRLGMVPSWYPIMRVCLTAIVSVSLAASLAGEYLYRPVGGAANSGSAISEKAGSESAKSKKNVPEVAVVEQVVVVPVQEVAKDTNEVEESEKKEVPEGVVGEVAADAKEVVEDVKEDVK